MISQTNSYSLGAIFGAGRSGTTWLGSVVSSHPNVAYRFEPFHRLQNKDKHLKEIRKKIESDSISSEDLSSLYQSLLPATPETEKPPFFSKTFDKPYSKGQKFLWPLARKLKIASSLFEYLYTPKSSPMIIFKEVTMTNLLTSLLEQTSIPIVYIIRHPCAVVASKIKGQETSLMPTGRRKVLKNLLLKSGFTWATKYAECLEELTIYEQEALLWSIEVEPSIQAFDQHNKGLIVIYENLTQTPMETYEKIFQHFGLDFSSRSQQFIEETTQGKQNDSRNRYGEQFSDSYFTVFRDPNVAREKWKNQLSPEQQKSIISIAENTEVFKMISNQGFW